LVNIILACAIAVSAQQYIKIADNAAAHHGIDTQLFRAIVLVESHFDPQAKNDKAPVWSYGIGQLTKATAIHRCKLSPDKIMDPVLNAECAAKVLAYQIDRYGGDRRKAVSAYNAGTYTERNVEYVEKVLAHLNLCPR
jgi:soluble lytic murein transglycosylase-like protein